MHGAESTQSKQHKGFQARFCVSDLPEPVRFDAWRDSIGCLFDVETSSPAGRKAPFHATIDSYALDTVMVACTRASAQHWFRSPLTVARNGLDHYMIQAYRRGTQRCEWSGGAVDMPADGVLVYDLAREMKAVATDLANISIFIPRAVLGPLLRAPDDQHMRFVGAHHPLGPLLRDHIVSLADRCPNLDPDMGRLIAPATVQLIAACLNGAADDVPRQGSGVDRALLDALRRDIERRLGDANLGPEDLQARHRLSRSRLYRLFEPVGGVAAYIRERRLRTAMAQLADPALGWRSIGGVADSLGFSSLPDFSRAFQRRYGMSPRAARHYGPATRGGTTPARGLDRRYESWIQALSA